MSKYSNEFKLMVVKEWLSGQNSLTELVKKYAINNDHAIELFLVCFLDLSIFSIFN